MRQLFSLAPILWPSLLAVALLIALLVFVWPRRKVPGARVFALSLVFGLLWAAGSVGEYAAVDPALKIFWTKFQVAWQLPATTAVTCFLLEYTWPGRWLTRRNVGLISIGPVVATALIVSNDLHHWFWLGFRVDGFVLPLQGPAARVLMAYGIGLVVINFIALGWLFLHSPQHRLPVVLIVIGQIGMRTLYMLEQSAALGPGLHLEIFGVAFVNLMYTTALFRFRILDPIPLAQQAAIEQMQSGMMVLDARGCIVSLNPYAERVLGYASREAKGKPVRTVLPTFPEETRPAAGGTEVEIAFSEDDVRCYLLNISPLMDFRGTEAGRLVLLHDVTEQIKAQAQIIAQQRSLAMLQEREQLARELHDSTAQVLGYASLQLDVVQHAVQCGQAAVFAEQTGEAIRQLKAAEAQLDRLGTIVTGAHADVREYILNLHRAPTDRQPFMPTLRQYLEGFSQNFDIRTELSLGPGIDEETIDRCEQMQLFRIVQEALSNARKHSGAKSVQVALEAKDHCVCIEIRDDGCGFDPKTVETNGGCHFGLRFMRERAEQIGGNLRVESSSGYGTCVVVEVPVKPQVLS